MNATTAARFEELLGLRSPAIAIAFREEAPADVAHIASPALASCAYWRRAAAGEVFYTDAADHFGCPIGAHTHGAALPPEKEREFQGLFEMMFDSEYLRPEEVAQVPARRGPFGVAVYAPLADFPGQPDVVIVRGDSRQLMILVEAVQSSGCATETRVLGRPTCCVIPQAIEDGLASYSLGCIGNRVYTELDDAESYVALPGARLAEIAERLEVIVAANRSLEAFHRAR